MSTTRSDVWLACGIASSLVYGTMLVFVPMHWPGYDSASQAISELSAIGAPTRFLWVPFGFVYTVLVVAFGWGVWRSARDSRRLRVAGAALMFHGIFGLFWPPMHLRGVEPTLTDALHIVWTAVTLALMLITIGFAAAGLGNRFRLYSVATVAVFITAGTLTSLEAPNLAANLPTPTLGVWERVNVAADMLWVAVFAVALLRRTRKVREG